MTKLGAPGTTEPSGGRRVWQPAREFGDGLWANDGSRAGRKECRVPSAFGGSGAEFGGMEDDFGFGCIAAVAIAGRFAAGAHLERVVFGGGEIARGVLGIGQRQFAACYFVVVPGLGDLRRKGSLERGGRRRGPGGVTGRPRWPDSCSREWKFVRQEERENWLCLGSSIAEFFVLYGDFRRLFEATASLRWWLAT